MNQNLLTTDINDFLSELLESVREFNNRTGQFIQAIHLETDLTPNAAGTVQVYSIFPPSMNLHPVAGKPARPAARRKAKEPTPPGDE